MKKVLLVTAIILLGIGSFSCQKYHKRPTGQIESISIAEKDLSNTKEVNEVPLVAF